MNVPVLQSPWLKRQAPLVSHGRWRLLCCPYAGGSAGMFRAWPRYVPVDVDVWGVQYPGREERLREAPLATVVELAEAIVRELRTGMLDRPLAIFGHSLGALVAFEIARQLRAEHCKAPSHLFLSGACGPRINVHRHAPRHLWPDLEFIEEMKRMKGTPSEVFENPHLMSLVMRTLRQDLAAVDTYEYSPQEPLCIPIHTFGGLEDHDVSGSDLAQWQEQTRGPFSKSTFAGDHFFLRGAAPALCSLMSHLLDAAAASHASDA